MKRTGAARLTVGLLADVVAAYEKAGYVPPADRETALKAMSETIAAVITLASTFEGKPLGEVPTADAWWRMGLRAVRIVDRRQR